MCWGWLQKQLRRRKVSDNLNTTGDEHSSQKKLKGLFDYQRFANSKRLASLIEETESRYSKELDDDDLDFVNAAGDPHSLPKESPFGKGNQKNE